MKWLASITLRRSGGGVVGEFGGAKQVRVNLLAHLDPSPFLVLVLTLDQGRYPAHELILRIVPVLREDFLGERDGG